MKINIRVANGIRNPLCTDCRMCQGLEPTDVCLTAQGRADAPILIVTRGPLWDRGHKEMMTYLKRAGFDESDLAFTGAVKCAGERSPSKTDMKACRHYLDEEIQRIQPKWVLAFGNEALFATTGRSGIMKYRGQIYDHPHGPKVMATITPAMIHRDPGQKTGFEADLRYMHAMIAGTKREYGRPTKDQYVVVSDKAALFRCSLELATAAVAAFDIESTGFDEFADDSKIISLSITTRDASGKTMAFAIPLWHPDSPWRGQWEWMVQFIGRKLFRIKKLVAHNGKFDCRWLRHFGVDNAHVTFDTMLAAHQLDEARPKGLKPLCRMLLGVDAWDISITSSKDKPWWEDHSLEDILMYNALDTWHDLQLYDVLREDLLKNKRSANLFAKVVIPASNELIDVERHGVWTDAKAVHKNWRIAWKKLQDIDGQLTEFVPEDMRETINWNPSNFSRWFLYEHLELPILARGKTKDDGSLGAPSMAEAVLMTLAEQTQHPALKLMLERTKWFKYCSGFFAPYSELIDHDGYLHTTFKLHGTVTGRLASGKPDADKVTGLRANKIRGVNLQQVPRDAFVRGVFGAPPGSYFVEADYSQIELRVAAFLANEPTMLHLYNTGQDIHMSMAMRMTGKPQSEITKEERKRAKAVNFGFLYGMGWFKFIGTAWSNYGIHVSEVEAKAFRATFFREYPVLLRWHAQQRAFVEKYGYVVSPMGRIRHLPAITSRDKQMRAEAERQAINSPVQAFASDMALMSLVLVSREFRRRGMDSRVIGTVHDAVNFEVPADEMATALPIIKNTMENLPLTEWFDLDFNIPIIADVKAGSRWGTATELTAEQVFNWRPELVSV